MMTTRRIVSTPFEAARRDPVTRKGGPFLLVSGSHHKLNFFLPKVLHLPAPYVTILHFPGVTFLKVKTTKFLR